MPEHHVLTEQEREYIKSFCFVAVWAAVAIWAFVEGRPILAILFLGFVAWAAWQVRRLAVLWFVLLLHRLGLRRRGD